MEIENMRYAAGIDVGGTFVKLALVTEKGDLLFEDKLAIGEKASRENILDTIKKAIVGLMAYARENNIQVDGIGMGTPGVVDNGVVLGGAENLDGWENLDLSTIFSTAFGLPVLVENDANVMGLGESVFGAAKNCTDVLFFTVGTGIGGAMIINGQLYSGYKNRGAELGHFVIEHKGIDCNCGGRGCLEAYASTSALIKQYAARTGKDAATIDGRYIVDQFLSGEEHALACMNEHADYLGHGIASFINTFAPQKVVIGGGISESGQFYIDLIKKAVFNYVMPDCARYTEIVGASLGNKAGCLGAASLVFKHTA
jgi:glucokinase